MNKIAVLGPKGTYTEKAAKEYMKIKGLKGELKYFKSLRKTFDSVGTDCKLGVIPIENTLDGFVQIILDLLTHSNLNIIHEIVLPVRFAFIGNAPLEEIEEVYAQFKSKNQCTDFLEEIIEKKVYITESNSESYEKVINGGLRTGAIVPMHVLKEKYQFHTIIKDIADSIENETRFIILSRNENNDNVFDKVWKTLLVIHDDSDRPGLLVDILNIFSDEGINLLSIISRPTKKGLGNYNFFIDVDGCYQRDEHVKLAIKKVTKKYKIRVLGSYYRVN